jgi:hypothetical protein
MHPDSGCYAEPYRLTWQNTVIITVGLLSIAAGAGSVSSTVAAGLSLAGLGVLMTAPLAFLIVTRRIAFRADREGITFGPQPVPFMPGRRFFWVSVRWDDVKEIRLDKEPIRGEGSGGKFVRIVPVPRHPGNAAAGQSLWLAFCRLDVKRLAAVTAAHAPHVAIVDAIGGIHNADADPDTERRNRWGFLK